MDSFLILLAAWIIVSVIDFVLYCKTPDQVLVGPSSWIYKWLPLGGITAWLQFRRQKSKWRSVPLFEG